MANENYSITPQAAPAAPVPVAVDVDGAAMIADLSTAVMSYCSMQIESVADKVKAYNAMANTSDVLAEHIGEEIPMRHVYVEVIECENPATGEKEKCPRIVLIASDGRTFQAVSRGVFGSLKQIMLIDLERKKDLQQIPAGKLSEILAEKHYFVYIQSPEAIEKIISEKLLQDS